MSKSLYDVISVQPTATQEEIDTACLRLGQKYSAAKKQGDLQSRLLFIEVERAYEILGDGEKRRKYDEELRHSDESTLINRATDASPISKVDASSSYVLWIVAALIAVLAYSKITSPTTTVDFHKVHVDAQQSSRAEIEREELRRERYGEAPLTKDEIAEISDKHVLNEIRKGKR